MAGLNHNFSVHSTPWCVLWCDFKWCFRRKFLSHLEQLNGFSSVWILSWVFKLPFCVKVLSHFEQLNGFSSVCILSWVFKLPSCVKVLSHFEQLNSFSSVYILLWVKYEDRGETNNQGKEVQDCWLYCCLNFKGQDFWPLTVSKTEIQKISFVAINFSFLGMKWVPSR